MIIQNLETGVKYPITEEKFEALGNKKKLFRILEKDPVEIKVENEVKPKENTPKVENKNKNVKKNR